METVLYYYIILVMAIFIDARLVVLKSLHEPEEINPQKSETKDSVEAASSEAAAEGNTQEKSNESDENLSNLGDTDISGLNETFTSEEDMKYSNSNEEEDNDLSGNDFGELSDDTNYSKLNVKHNNGLFKDSDENLETNNKKSNKSREKKLKSLTSDLWKSERNAGNVAEFYATNPHIYQPNEYINLSRRFVPQYPYTYVKKNYGASPINPEIIPIEAPIEIVDMVAKQSAKIEALKPKPVDEKLTKKMLRSGDYWNGVWKEDVNPKLSLRTPEHSALGTIKARIKPGNEFYDLVAGMKKMSPRLLYIINVDN